LPPKSRKKHFRESTLSKKGVQRKTNRENTRKAGIKGTVAFSVRKEKNFNRIVGSDR